MKHLRFQSVKPLIHPSLLACACISHAAPPSAAIFEEYDSSLEAIVPLEEGWENPPRTARTRAYWWWLNGNTDKLTITRELEAMKDIGMGGALVFDAGGDNRRLPHGPDFASPEWIELFRHAMAEADRLGLEMGLNIQSGWNLGGPEVKPEEACKRVTFSKVEVDGGRTVKLTLPQPPTKGDYYQDVAVLAIPLDSPDQPRIKNSKASSSQPDHGAANAIDGDPATFWVSAGTRAGDGPSPEHPQSLGLDLKSGETAHGIVIHPRPGYGPTRGWIGSVEKNTATRVASFKGDGTRPIHVAFEPTTATNWIIQLTGARDTAGPRPRNVQIAEVAMLTESGTVGGPRASSQGVHQLDQKAYFRYPGDYTGTAAWHLLDIGPFDANEPAAPPENVIDLTASMDTSGRLRWHAPAGRWEILRFGSTLTGSHVSTHSEGWSGLSIDYLDRAALDSYWGRVVDPILEAVQPHIGRSLRFLHTDSWELGPVNWTRLMPAEFQRLRGYDIKPWLPVLAGRIVGTREQTHRFLNDFRLTIADLIAERKYEAFSEKSRARGLGIHPESGGPHAAPIDALRCLGISDVPMGEFWSRSPRHRTRDDQRFFVKQTSSAAHIYGRRVAQAEAFTNIGRHWQHDPRSLKPTFDRAACEGHNLSLWHTFPSSKAEHGMPGAAYFAGEHFHPNITWWHQGKAFLAYLNRSHFMLQQGVAVSDVLHFYGENIPSFVRLKRDDPAKCLPGYDYDVINAHALLHRVDVDADGRAALPDGTRYRLISLTPHDAISLPTLRHLSSLVEKGATLVGPAPQRPFSLAGGKPSEQEFSRLTVRLWGEGARGEKKIGKGRVIWGRTTREVLQADAVPEDFSWTGGDGSTLIDYIHRRTHDTEIYFVANRNDRPEDVTLRFRTIGMTPEIWDPVTGTRREATEFRIRDGITEIPLRMENEEAFFVIFRKPTGDVSRESRPNTPTLRALGEITGPWQVSFDPEWGEPASVEFDELIDWTRRPEEGIRHYSGTAIYRKTFEFEKTGGPVYLDLGMVESLCEVTLNGTDLGTWWSFPFRREVTGVLKPGRNTLEVKVVNLWCNRIIGDAALPESKRRTRTNIQDLKANTPLEPSGLLGPVRFLQSK